MAAETVAFFALGGERDDYRCPFRPESGWYRFVWLGWVLAGGKQ